MFATNAACEQSAASQVRALPARISMKRLVGWGIVGQVSSSPSSEGLPGAAFWQQMLFVLGFFAKDDTVDFERTDAAVEKAVTLSFDLVGRNTLDSAVDFVRFLVQR